MESSDRADQRSEGDLVKNEPAAGRTQDELICNGRTTEEEVKTSGNKRKLAFSDVENGGKRAGIKVEDARNEIPAHHARRPPNGFLLFCKRHRDIVSSKNPNLENRGVTKLLGNWWRTLEEDERDKYKELARQNKEIFIANNPQFTWYKLPAPPLRTLVTRPSNRRPPKLEPTPLTGTGPITPGKLADESQLGGLTSLLSSSLSPPATPLNPSPPSAMDLAAPAPPKKRFLFQTRVSRHEGSPVRDPKLEEVVDSATSLKSNSDVVKKRFRKKKKTNSIEPKKNKLSVPEKMYPDTERNCKSENNCTQQHLIEKVVESSFDVQKTLPDYDVQRTIDYINTEHTYQKNPSRFWQQELQPQKAKKGGKKDLFSAEEDNEETEESEKRIIQSPNHNNNTIILPEGGPGKKNHVSYSFNDNNNLILNYFDLNQRNMDRLATQTNHDRIKGSRYPGDGEGYIPRGGNSCARAAPQDCDTSTRSEDQKKPLKIAQVDRMHCRGEEEADEEESGLEQDSDGDGCEDSEESDEDDEGEEENEKEGNALRREIPKNCDSVNANFQSILGRVSREIVSMMKERDAQDAESMAVAKFNLNLRSKSETDSEDGSWYDKSDESLPESPEGRRSKRSCKGQRYEQFIKDSVSKKRTKHSNAYMGMSDNSKLESRQRRRKEDKAETLEENYQPTSPGTTHEFLKKEREFADATKTEDCNQIDLILGVESKATDATPFKSDADRKSKKQADEKDNRRNKEEKGLSKKRPLSKVQMIKEKREIHIGEFNLNEKIEELPLLSFESFLQKKRQRKKRLLGFKKDGVRSRLIKSRAEKMQRKTSSKSSVSDPGRVGACTNISGQSMPSSRPDFADLTTLAETALTLLALREPR